MRCKTLTLSLMVLFGVGSLVFAQDDNPAYTNAEEAGIDFAIQGEYVGTVDADDGRRWGAQIIALGDGTFRSVGFLGGLPGDGWERGDESNSVDGQLDGDTAVFRGDEFVLKVKDGVMKIESPDGEAYGQLQKVVRKSTTLGAKPPAEAVVIFDGASVDRLIGGTIVEDDLLAATSVESKAKFGDHTLHVEFRTPFMPKSRGQGRGNSGVYVQSRYEVQVLDSFGLDGKDNECGGIYKVSEPKVNMCFPPLSWQTYDIDFTAARYDSEQKVKNARVTVRHNGVVIHDDIELPHGTPGRYPEGPQDAALFLQDHGNPVVFRNIWAVAK